MCPVISGSTNRSVASECGLRMASIGPQYPVMWFAPIASFALCRGIFLSLGAEIPCIFPSLCRGLRLALGAEIFITAIARWCGHILSVAAEDWAEWCPAGYLPLQNASPLGKPLDFADKCPLWNTQIFPDKYSLGNAPVEKWPFPYWERTRESIFFDLATLLALADVEIMAFLPSLSFSDSPRLRCHGMNVAGEG